MVFVAGISVSIFADYWVDYICDDSINDMGYRWYYYDDNIRVDADDRAQAAPLSIPSTIDVEYKDSLRHAFGNLEDNYPVKAYKFTTATENGQTFATMPFTFGENWQNSWDPKGIQDKSHVGIVTMLCDEKKSVDLSACETIKFKIRSHSQPLAVRFQIRTAEIEEISNVPDSLLDGDEFGFYGTGIDVTTDWQEITVPIEDVATPGTWAAKIDFNPGACTKLAWEIEMKANPDVLKDTLDIDDVVLTGINEDHCGWRKNIDIENVHTKMLLSDFETEPRWETSIGTSWYAFTDADNGGSTTFENGVISESASNQIMPVFQKNTGSNDSGYSICCAWKFGNRIDIFGSQSQGFGGIGCKLYDSAKAEYWNANENGQTIIYFKYKTDGAISSVICELLDIYDVADATKPDQATNIFSTGGYVILTSSNGQWSSVAILLDKMRNDRYGADGTSDIPLDKTKLAGVRWRARGGEGEFGSLCIDDVYLVNIGDVSVKQKKSSLCNNLFNVNYSRNSLKIKLSAQYSLKKGNLSIVNTLGKTVFRVPVESIKNNVEYRIDNVSLRSGHYVVLLNGTTSVNKQIRLVSHLNKVD